MEDVVGRCMEQLVRCEKKLAWADNEPMEWSGPGVALVVAIFLFAGWGIRQFTKPRGSQ